MMYPGILYSDTVARWENTFHLFAGLPISDHYPITPYFLMGALYAITGEVGIVTIVQSFLLCLGVFFLMAELTRAKGSLELTHSSLVAVAIMLSTPAAGNLRFEAIVLMILETRPAAELLWASPRELLNLFQADACGCNIITATADVLLRFA